MMLGLRITSYDEGKIKILKKQLYLSKLLKKDLLLFPDKLYLYEHNESLEILLKDVDFFNQFIFIKIGSKSEKYPYITTDNIRHISFKGFKKSVFSPSTAYLYANLIEESPSDFIEEIISDSPIYYVSYITDIKKKRMNLKYEEKFLDKCFKDYSDLYEKYISFLKNNYPEALKTIKQIEQDRLKNVSNKS